MNENELKKQKEHQAKLNKEVLATLEKQVLERDALVEDAGRVAEDIEDAAAEYLSATHEEESVDVGSFADQVEANVNKKSQLLKYMLDNSQLEPDADPNDIDFGNDGGGSGSDDEEIKDADTVTKEIGVGMSLLSNKLKSIMTSGKKQYNLQVDKNLEESQSKLEEIPGLDTTKGPSLDMIPLLQRRIEKLDKELDISNLKADSIEGK